MRGSGRAGLEDHSAHVTGTCGPCNPYPVALRVGHSHITLIPLQCPSGMQRQLGAAAPKHRSVLGYLQGVGRAAIVEARLAFDNERHLPPDHTHYSHQPMPVGRPARLGDGHEVQQLPDSVWTHEPGQQDRALRQIELAGDVALVSRSDPEVAALLAVEQRREDARRVESRQAQPIDLALGTDQRCRMQVADQTMISDRRIALHAHHPGSTCEPRKARSPGTPASHSRRSGRQGITPVG
jgi:hypothetical protein